MFKSFFPKPGPFFLSAFVWALIAVIFWQAGGGDWVARITGASGQIPISAARFWSLDFLIFYAYYIVCASSSLLGQRSSQRYILTAFPPGQGALSPGHRSLPAPYRGHSRWRHSRCP